ncbi:hypothetical protein F4802DRAFT_433088 [Xylaria palmicola]|nr:hypothetical protein F4802DRAFT_433088 [Xylaria palmicola]
MVDALFYPLVYCILQVNMDPDRMPTPLLTGAMSSKIHTQFIVASAIILFLSLSGIAARTYTKAAVMSQFDITDFILLVAGVLLGAFVSAVLATSFGDVLKLVNIMEILYCPTMFCAKYVVLRQIELVFFNHRRKAVAFTAIRILIWANLLFYAAIFLSFIFACVPRAKISNPSLPGTCAVDTQAIIIATSAINVFSDLTILITPIIVIWKLQVPIKRKLGSAAVFGVGIMCALLHLHPVTQLTTTPSAIITSIARLCYSIKLATNSGLTWIVGPFGSWTLGELGAVILVACVPYFPRLYQHLMQKHHMSGYPIPNDGTPNPLRHPVTRGSRLEHEHWYDTSATFKAPGDSVNDIRYDEVSLNDQTRQARVGNLNSLYSS